MHERPLAHELGVGWLAAGLVGREQLAPPAVALAVEHRDDVADPVLVEPPEHADPTDHGVERLVHGQRHGLGDRHRVIELVDLVGRVEDVDALAVLRTAHLGFTVPRLPRSRDAASA